MVEEREGGLSQVENLLGAAAALCTTLSFVPQTIKIIRERQTAGISLVMYSLFTLGILLWTIYGILIQSAPVYLANGATLCLAGTILAMKIKFG